MHGMQTSDRTHPALKSGGDTGLLSDDMVNTRSGPTQAGVRPAVVEYRPGLLESFLARTRPDFAPLRKPRS
jgi:hypothetical protein